MSGGSIVRAAGRWVAAGLVVGALTVGTAGGPAYAGTFGGHEPGPRGGDTGNDGETTTGQVHNCTVISSSSYLGLACGHAGKDGKTIKEILDGDPVPGCWDEPLTEAELAAIGATNVPGPGGKTWYWQWCLHGIDENYQVGPDGISFTQTLTSIDNGDPVETLTPHQQVLIDVERKDGQIPFPVAVTSPSKHPRVGADIAFFDGQDTHEVAVEAGGLLLRALVTKTTVLPLGAGNPASVSCDGAGHRAERGDTPANRPGLCWYRYQHSSAGAGPAFPAESRDKYPAEISEHWLVEYSDDGGASWHHFNDFDKSQQSPIEVSEIQALVVS